MSRAREPVAGARENSNRLNQLGSVESGVYTRLLPDRIVLRGVHCLTVELLEGRSLFYVVDLPLFQTFEVAASGSGEPKSTGGMGEVYSLPSDTNRLDTW